MKKHEKARLLAIVVSRWLYSEATIPPKINKIFLKFTERGILPNDEEVAFLLAELDESYQGSFCLNRSL